MKKYKLTLFGVKDTTRLLALSLHQAGIKIDLIVSIEPKIAELQDIADFTDLKATAVNIGADYHCVSDYSLRKNLDPFFKQHCFELGIVYGWQRLIPESVIQQFDDGLFGFHASPDKLPKGRGRSPMNWSLILGKTKLFNHCFKYNAAADAGDIYAITPFEITAHDTIHTLLYKSLLIAHQNITCLIDDLNAQTLQCTAQQGDAYFFPKRTPEEGRLHFNSQSTQSLVDLIRALTHPFPGAFCYTSENHKITFWEAWPFDSLIDFSAYQPGEVIAALYHRPIIKTIDGTLIVHHYEGGPLQPHMKLLS